MFSRSLFAVALIAPAASLIVIPSRTLDAQQMTTPVVGDRVRIKADARTLAGGSTIGTLVSTSEDSVVIDADGGLLYIPAASVRRLDVSRGRRNRGTGLLRGAGGGLLIGGVAGAVIGAATYEECRSEEFLGCLLSPTSPAESAMWGGFVVGVVGAVIGGVVGLASPGERWQRTSWAQSVSVVPAAGGGMGLSVRKSF